MIGPHKNPPKFFFNFIGPQSDDLDYMPVILEAEPTPADPVSGEGLSKAAAKDKEDPTEKKQKIVIVDLEENPDAVDENPVVGLTTKGAKPPTEKKQKNAIVDLEENPDPVDDNPVVAVVGLTTKGAKPPTEKKQKNVIVDLEENPDPVDDNPVVAVVGLTTKGAKPSGSCRRGKKRGHEEIAKPERMNNFSEWLKEMLHGHKRVKVTEVKKKP